MLDRKAEHLRFGVSDEGQFTTRSAGFERYRLEHRALPELALEDVDLATRFLDRDLRAPLLVSSMTGGPESGETINGNLAEAAEALGIAMGVGSQRVAIDAPSVARTFRVARERAPSAVLFGNLGAVQLNYGFGADHARRAVEMLRADGLFLHLNALQEAVQPEGDTNFRGLLDKIEALVREVDFPILVKECGVGISGALASELFHRGVAAVDVAGAGGTSWAAIEGLRAKDPAHRALGEVFRDFGIPTTVALTEARALVGDRPLIASGGVRNGLDVAKALALGADLVAVAKPVLSAALESAAAAHAALEQILLELRVACFVTGSSAPRELRGRIVIASPP
ncbi:MAG: type 2 isopentenyl-diphosphate Delta-isomerase [Deltaproteobacteria bacterium]|nr:type 2 isopentenyl-diphosphate Delta-isomerase [Deltaproteobacteria bacterium]